MFPSIRLTNESLFAYLLNNFTILGVGVGDLNYNARSMLDNNLYILVDVQGTYSSNRYVDKAFYLKKFKSGLEMIKHKQGFVADYTYQDNYHMIVVNLPFEDMKFKFLQGQYSQLFSKEEDINLLFPKTKKNGKIELRNQDNLVLHKSDKGRANFREILKKEFGYIEDIAPNIELDLPPLFKEEVFNNHLLI